MAVDPVVLEQHAGFFSRPPRQQVMGSAIVIGVLFQGGPGFQDQFNDPDSRSIQLRLAKFAGVQCRQHRR